nr:hypothetical protein [Nocardioides marinisabuli]
MASSAAPRAVVALVRTARRAQPQQHGERRTGHQLVEPGVGGVVRPRGVDLGPDELVDGRGDHQADQHAEQHDLVATAPAPPHQQHQGEQHVELLLHRERPEVQERRLLHVAGEVVGAVEDELPVGDVQQRRAGLRDELEALGLRGEQHEEGARAEDGDDGGRQQPTGATREERPQPQLAAGARAVQHHGGDQEAGQHEEEVQAQEAVGEAGQLGVEEQHQHHRDGADAVELRAVGERGGRRPGRRRGRRRRAGRGRHGPHLNFAIARTRPRTAAPDTTRSVAVVSSA